MALPTNFNQTLQTAAQMALRTKELGSPQHQGPLLSEVDPAVAQLITDQVLRERLTPSTDDVLGEFGQRWRQSIQTFAQDENAWREFGQSMREFFDQATQAGDTETARLAGQVYQLAARQRAMVAGGQGLPNLTDEERRLLQRFARFTDDGWYLAANDLKAELPKPPEETPLTMPQEKPTRRGVLDDLSEKVGLDKRSLIELLMILLLLNRR